MPLLVIGGITADEARVLGEGRQAEGYLEVSTLIGGVDRRGPNTSHLWHMFGLTTGSGSLGRHPEQCDAIGLLGCIYVIRTVGNERCARTSASRRSLYDEDASAKLRPSRHIRRGARGGKVCACMRMTKALIPCMHSLADFSGGVLKSKAGGHASMKVTPVLRADCIQDRDWP